MAEIVIVGGGVAGLGSALTLSRVGHRVTVLERDATPLPANPDAAFAWDRRGAPQVRHSHAFLARLRNLLVERHPDVLAALLAAGATEMAFAEHLPETLDDRSPQPGDDELVALACRRTTFEWVLRRAVLDDGAVTMLDGASVTGLEVAASDGDAPTVTGVTLTHGDEPERALSADVVVVATGRRSGLPRWLADHGVELPTVEEDTGIVYLSRFYRLRDGVEAPPADGPIGGDLGYLKYAIFPGDNRTFSITFAVRTHDDELRKALLDPDTFEAAARALVATAPWMKPGLADPITEVHVMAGLLNRLATFDDDAGMPRVLGLHAVGDAHTCTNPLYGRGCTLGFVGATLLGDALAAHPDDAVARSQAYEASCRAEIEPWYRASVMQDRLGRADAARDARGADVAEGEPASDEASPSDVMRQIMRHGLLPAVRSDAVVFRAFVRSFNLLDPPEQLMSDPDLVARVMQAYNERDQRPPEPVLGPPRDEMLATLASAT